MKFYLAIAIVAIVCGFVQAHRDLDKEITQLAGKCNRLNTNKARIDLDEACNSQRLKKVQSTIKRRQHTMSWMEKALALIGYNSDRSLQRQKRRYEEKKLKLASEHKHLNNMITHFQSRINNLEEKKQRVIYGNTLDAEKTNYVELLAELRQAHRVASDELESAQEWIRVRERQIEDLDTEATALKQQIADLHKQLAQNELQPSPEA